MTNSLPPDLIRELDQIAREYDANATLRYNFLADGIYWDDEYPQVSSAGDGVFRRLLHFRSLVIMNRSTSAAYQELWDQAKLRFSAWPGFRIERSLPAPELQRFYSEKSEYAMKSFDELDSRWDKSRTS